MADRTLVKSMQTTYLLEERLEKLERKGKEQEAIVQMLLKDMEDQRIETKSQAEIIQDLSMKLEFQTEQLIKKEKKNTELEIKLDEILDRQYSTDENFKNISGENFNQSSRNKRTSRNDDQNHAAQYMKTRGLVPTTRREKKSIRQRRLELPVPTQLPKMNIAFLVSNSEAGLVKVGPIIFNTVEMKLGDGFDPSSGIFTSPTNGSYLFSLTFRFIGSGQMVLGAGILKNNVNLDIIYINCEIRGDDQRSVTVVTHLNVGDRVTAEIYLLMKNVTTMDSTFSGVLISQT